MIRVLNKEHFHTIGNDRMINKAILCTNAKSKVLSKGLLYPPHMKDCSMKKLYMQVV